jgi:hypothetical protein
MQRTADRAARAAGSVYRVVAGTESLDGAIKTIKSDTDTLKITDGELQQGETNERTSRTTKSGQFSSVNTITHTNYFEKKYYNFAFNTRMIQD